MPSARNYRPRIADRELADRLCSAGAVVLEGARGCGKTETGRQGPRRARCFWMWIGQRTMRSPWTPARSQGGTPRLIDEWQLAPVLWNHVRRAVDERQASGQFILTGSAVPPDDATRHSGAGRFSRLRLRPMSLSELGHSNSAISLGALLDGEMPAGASADVSRRTAGRDSVCRWLAGTSSDLRLVRAWRPTATIWRMSAAWDLERVDGVRRDPQRVRRFLQSVARNVATCASLATITRDANGPDDHLKPPTRPRLPGSTRETDGRRRPTAVGRRGSARVPVSGPRRRDTSWIRLWRWLRSAPDPTDYSRTSSGSGSSRVLMVIRDLRVYAQAAEAEGVPLPGQHRP